MICSNNIKNFKYKAPVFTFDVVGNKNKKLYFSCTLVPEKDYKTYSTILRTTAMLYRDGGLQYLDRHGRPMILSILKQFVDYGDNTLVFLIEKIIADIVVEIDKQNNDIFFTIDDLQKQILKDFLTI